jgi:hypothetical protein
VHQHILIQPGDQRVRIPNNRLNGFDVRLVAKLPLHEISRAEKKGEPLKRH